MSLKNTTSCLGNGHLVGLPTAVRLLSLAPADTGKGPPTLAIIQVENQSVRWRDDGVAPTANIGMLVQAGGELLYDGDFTSMQMIETTGSATLNIAFYN